MSGPRFNYSIVCWLNLGGGLNKIVHLMEIGVIQSKMMQVSYHMLTCDLGKI